MASTRSAWSWNSGLLLGLAPLANHYKEAERTYRASKVQYEESKRIEPLGAAGPKRPYTDPKTYRDEWRAEGNLEAQWSMAEWTRWGAIATGAGIIILVATLLDSIAATRANTRATKAAERAVEQQLRLEGPFLHVEELVTDAKMFHDLHVRLRNSGKTPAILLRSAVEAKVGDDALTAQPQYGAFQSRDRSIIPKDGTFAIINFIGGDGLKRVFEGQIQAVVWGCVVYRNVFGQTRRMGFGRRTYPYNALLSALLKDPSGRATVLWQEDGGEAYNYDREEPPET